MRPLTRFVTDASLDELARRLRLLGHDVITHRGARLEELFEAASREGCTVLTLSERHPKRYAAVPVVRVARGDLAAALRAITAAHAPVTAPWSRCPACNVALHVRSAFEARGEVPGRVTRQGLRLTWCPSCARWFWPGSHVARLAAWFEQALGHPVPIPGPPGDTPPEPSEPMTG